MQRVCSNQENIFIWEENNFFGLFQGKCPVRLCKRHCSSIMPSSTFSLFHSSKERPPPLSPILRFWLLPRWKRRRRRSFSAWLGRFPLLLLLFFIHPGEQERKEEREGAVRLHPSSWVERWGEEKKGTVGLALPHIYSECVWYARNLSCCGYLYSDIAGILRGNCDWCKNWALERLGMAVFKKRASSIDVSGKEKVATLLWGYHKFTAVRRRTVF